MSKGDFIKGKQPQEDETQPTEVKSKLCFYIALGCFIVGCVLFGVSFAAHGAGVYLILASMILELASVSFLNGQKKHGYFKLCTVLRIVSYVVMIAGLAVVLAGMAATAK